MTRPYPPEGWSIDKDTRFGNVKGRDLISQLRGLGLSVEVDSVHTDGGKVWVRFRGNPNAEDKAKLDTAIRAHGSAPGPP